MSPTNQAHLRLETLDDRIVPATFDLTAFGSATGIAGGAIVHRMDSAWNDAQGVASYGTGAERTFVKMDGTGVEQGYNTDARPLQFSEVDRKATATHSLQLSQVPVVTVGGVQYREFLLDVQQTRKNPLLSLDEARIYIGNVGNLSGYNTTTKTLAGQTAIYDMDAVTDDTILLKARQNEPGGPGEMALLVPNSLFVSAPSGSFVYLYSKLGGLAGAGANGSAETWGTRDNPPVSPPPPPPPPPPAPASISGHAFVDVNNNQLFDVGDEPLAGFTITLSGVDEFGNNLFPVADPTVVTSSMDDIGAFSFTNLPVGIYQISITDLSPYMSQTGVLGVGDGNLDGELAGMNTVLNINLSSGENGINYGFILVNTGG